MSQPSVVIAVGQSFQIRPTFLDQHGRCMSVSASSVSFSSDAPGIATVDAEKGIILGVSAGSATITATSGSLSSSRSVTIYAPVATSLVI